jgi:hypothetical protein
MPITGPSSYLPTIDLFLSHWESANAALGAVVLENGADRASLLGLQADLEVARDAVTDASVDLALVRASLTQALTVLQARCVEFNARVRGDLAGTIFPAALPEAFSVGQGEAIVRDNLRKVSRLWLKVNALGVDAPTSVTLPFALGGGYALADLDAARDVLRDAYRAVSDAEVDLALARGNRNATQVEIYAILKSYRQKITGYAASQPALFATLPALTPAPGHTPDPVPVQAVWDAPSTSAKITWTASADAALERYELRACAGADYDSDDEVLIATVQPGAPLEAFSAFSLGTPGITAGFKIYVILTTGNERGSEPAYVQRPV